MILDIQVSNIEKSPICLDIMEYRMGGGHLADIRRIRKQGAKLQDVVDFFLKKVRTSGGNKLNYYS